jgi:hypothetical protein
MRDLYKRKEESKQQSMDVPDRLTKSTSLSISNMHESKSSIFMTYAKSAKNNNSSMVMTPKRDKSPGKIYRTNIEKMQLVNEIESRRLA